MFGPDLSQRSQALELLDAPDIPPEDLWRNLAELDLINRTLGGHAVTLAGLQRLIQDRSRVWRIADIGCGGGDSLKAIAAWAQRQGIKVALTGVDLKPECLEFARKSCQGLPIQWLATDYRAIEAEFDIIVTSLFCHHLDPSQLRDFLIWSGQRAQMGLVINDLHRHALAWWSIRLLTGLFSRSYLVRNDAPLSVWRGFSRSELELALADSGWKAEVEWRWAFRYLVVGYA
jgi:SAM-dependent methyltransferase